MLNRIGPRTEPCGTPYLSVCRHDVVWRILTELDRPMRYEVNHSITVPSNPNSRRADAVVWCGLACRKRHSGQATQAGHCVASRSRAVDHCEFSQERSLCCGLGGMHSGMDH